MWALNGETWAKPSFAHVAWALCEHYMGKSWAAHMGPTWAPVAFTMCTPLLDGELLGFAWVFMGFAWVTCGVNMGWAHVGETWVRPHGAHVVQFLPPTSSPHGPHIGLLSGYVYQ